MKLKYLNEDSLNYIKTNKKECYEALFIKNKNLDEILDEGILESDIDYDRFDLDMSLDDKYETDFENVKIVYEHLKQLTNSQAADERIWVALILGEHKKYIRYRFNIDNEEQFNNRCLFGYSKQRSLLRNGLARLWWIGRLTYDSKREDPYELTKLMCSNQNIIEAMLGRNVFNNKHIVKPTLSALLECQNNGIVITKELIENIGKYVNTLGSVYILDLMEEKVIYDRIIKRIQK